MYKLCFFVPEDHAEQVKKAVFESGAGKLGAYAECCWQTLGIGQFRPLSKSQPFLGETGRLEHVQELKIEMLCQSEFIQQAIAALKKAHPYEEPAYEVIRLECF
jgi:hypothetical protein